MSIYGDPETEAWFAERYRASGKTLDMGKSCVRFKSLNNLPLDLIGKAIARTTVADFIERYETSRRLPRTANPLKGARKSRPPRSKGAGAEGV